MAGGSPPLNGSSSKRAQRVSQALHALTQSFLIGTERNPQEAPAFFPERRCGNRHDTLLQTRFGNFQFIAVFTYIDHCVESSIGSHAAQSEFVAQLLQKK